MSLLLILKKVYISYTEKDENYMIIASILISSKTPDLVVPDITNMVALSTEPLAI